MILHSNFNNFSAINPVVTIGTFDGLHRGHFKVLSGLIQKAKEIGGESVVFTFSEHPRTVLHPDERELKLLSSFQEKLELFEKSGIDHLVAIPFTKEFSQLSYEEFVKIYLMDKIKINTLVVGHDNQFGNNREGGGEKLSVLSEKYQFSISLIDALVVEETSISSTKIRNALAIGHISIANKYLGYKYSVNGVVVMGKQIGRTIGYPTANIQVADKNKLIPSNGVYAVLVEIDNVSYKGMLNIGSRPTIDHPGQQKVTIEVNIFNFTADIYNRNIKVSFVEWLREEKKFDGLGELKQQLSKDKVKSLKILA